MNTEKTLITDYNHARWRPEMSGGHYESFWLRANHPSRALAFWIRYTLFSPKGRPQDAIGELWVIWSDGERRALTVAKREVPISDCRFAPDALDIVVADARLRDGLLQGSAESKGHRIAWDLRFGGGQAPLFHLPATLYTKPLPKAKSLVGMPNARFDGEIVVDGIRMPIENWIGSQNHNWGSKHTDHYAYGQVAGFDNAPDSFLETATARIKLGPFWTPFMTPIVLRHGGEEFALNALRQTLRNKGAFSCFDWTFSAENAEVHIEGRIHAPKDIFVGLHYYNPPGNDKCCLNSKLAACELTLTDKRLGKHSAPQKLHTAHRAAFEMASDDFTGHGVPVRA